MIDTMIYEIANVGLTIFFVVLLAIIVNWVGNKI